MDKKQKAIKAVMIAFQIIGTATYALVTAFLIVTLVFAFQRFAQIGMWVVGGVAGFTASIVVSKGYIIPVVIGGIGAVISSKMQERKSKIYFIFMIFVPIATAVASLLTCIILLYY